MKEKPAKRGRTYVAFLLDRSGSMERIKQQADSGYNEQVQVLLEEASKPDRGETFASLVTFNGRITEDFFNALQSLLTFPTVNIEMRGVDAALFQNDLPCREMIRHCIGDHAVHVENNRLWVKIHF